jgi:PPM family protein phosphatase
MGFAAGNAQHIGARPQQQDAFGFSDPSDRGFVSHGGFLGVVADGVGGLTHGSEASQSAVRNFLQAYHLKSPQESIPDALARSLREANAAVLRVASSPSAEGAGTTLVAAVLHDQSLYWIAAGDSRIYLLNGSRLTRITSDHTYARHLDEQAAQGLISRDEAQNNSERGALTSYLGQSEPKEVDRNTRPLRLQPDDCVILCSDGFYRALDELEMVEAFRNDLPRACDLLVQRVLAKQRKQQDNLTVIALRQSSRKGKAWSQIRGEKRFRLEVFAAAATILVLLSTGAGYWYEKHSAGTEQAPQIPSTQAPNSSPPRTGNTAGDATAKPPENPPPPEVKQQAVTKPATSSRRRPHKPQSKAPTSTAPKNDAGGSPQTSPGGTEEATPGPDQSAPVDGGNPPASAPPAAQPPPPDQPAGAEGKAAPPGQAPGSNQEKPQPPPPPAPDAKPNGPPNLALGTTRSTLHTSGRDLFCVQELGWALGTKDGKSCHS